MMFQLMKNYWEMLGVTYRLCFKCECILKFINRNIISLGRTFFTYSCYSKPWTVCQLLQHLEKSGTVLFLVQCLCRALLWLLLLNFYEVLVFIRVDIVSAAAAMLLEMTDLELLQFKNMVKKVSRWFCLDFLGLFALFTLLI